MKKATLMRQPSSDAGTPGNLLTEAGFSCATIERPWRDNKRCVSCIPAGVYIFDWVKTPQHGDCYLARNVTDRSAILIHSANVAGDEEQGYLAQLKGCLALGRQHATFRAGQRLSGTELLKDQIGVTSSKSTCAKFAEHMNHESFELTIKEAKP